MRVAHLIIFAVPAIWLTEAAAQEPTEESLQDVLCEQCPYDAPVRVPAPNEFTPEMRRLGVTSVRDMINQLPNNIASVSPEATVDSPFYLGASIASMRDLTSREIAETAGGESESATTDDRSSEDNPDSGEEESDTSTNDAESEQ
jgi:hypothetical protein